MTANTFCLHLPGRATATTKVQASPGLLGRWAQWLTELRIEKHEIGYAETSAEAALRRDPELDRIQGTDRRARAKAWHRALHKAGWNPASSLTVLPRTRHNFTCAHRHGLTQTVFRLLGHEGPAQ